MKKNLWLALALTTAVLPLLTPSSTAQAPDFPPPGGPGGPGGPDGPGGFGGPPPFGVPGGPGGPNQPELKVVKKFDTNGDKQLDAKERVAAREFVKKERASNEGGRGPGGRRGPGGPGPGGRGGMAEPTKPGPKVAPADVKWFSGTNLYDPGIIRTLFLEFENADWEKELADFANTDVEIPASVTVDGRSYAGVGVHFRGASSLFTVGEGSKRSLNLSFDFIHHGQNLLGYRTLNLLNSHEDPSYLRTVLYCEIARHYLPAPRANFVKVVINGESWGLYVSAQQFNKDFLHDQFPADDGGGARWKVPGSPRGRGSLAYLGEAVGDYRGIYELHSKEDPKAWAALIQLCRTLNETPVEQLESALALMLDIDGALRFLALENALINNDGYWVRTSDYNLYRDPKGRFHLVPHDANETFSLPGGPGFGRRGGPGGFGGPGGPGLRPGEGFDGPGSPGPGGPGAEGGRLGGRAERGPGIEGLKLDPLFGTNDTSKPLLSKLLAVPALRVRYLGYVKDIAERWLDWRILGPIATRYHQMIEPEVAADTRKLQSIEAFRGSLAVGPRGINAPNRENGNDDTSFRPGPGRGPGGPSISLKAFADQRRAYLLERVAELDRSPAGK